MAVSESDPLCRSFAGKIFTLRPELSELHGSSVTVIVDHRMEAALSGPPIPAPSTGVWDQPHPYGPQPWAFFSPHSSKSSHDTHVAPIPIQVFCSLDFFHHSHVSHWAHLLERNPLKSSVHTASRISRGTATLLYAKQLWL